MPEINYKEIDQYIGKEKSGDRHALYLIYGEESLYKTAFNHLLDAMLPTAERGFNYDPVDGAGDNMDMVVEKMNTFSLLSGTKVIAYLDAKIFYSKQDHGKLFEKAKEAFSKDDFKNAAKSFSNALGRMNLSYEEFDTQDKAHLMDAGIVGDGKWLEDISQYCREHEIAIPKGGGRSHMLERAIEKGFPKGNHLIITTDYVDKRRSLFKVIQKDGLIVDCSVPKGDRRDDRIAQEAVLREETRGILQKGGKTIEKEAFRAAIDMTGFDIRIFCSNIEKLVDYIGERRTITVDDVASLLKRTKQDPIYELTNAISERHLEHALIYLNSLLSGGYHPLQVLSAIINQVRRLMVAREFLESEYAGSWEPDMNFTRFRNHVMPNIQAYDKAFAEELNRWNDELGPDPGGKKGKQSKKKKKKAASDLLLSRSSGSPYPLFLMLKHCRAYPLEHITEAFQWLHKADVQLKSTGQNPRMILESVLFRICGGEEER